MANSKVQQLTNQLTLVNQELANLKITNNNNKEVAKKTLAEAEILKKRCEEYEKTIKELQPDTLDTMKIQIAVSKALEEYSKKVEGDYQKKETALDSYRKIINDQKMVIGILRECIHQLSTVKTVFKSEGDPSNQPQTVSQNPQPPSATVFPTVPKTPPVQAQIARTIADDEDAAINNELASLLIQNG